MKKAMVISILCVAFLSACGNAAETAEIAVSIETSAMSQTTTTVTASAVTSAKEEKDTSETTTTTRKSSQTVSETSASMETIKAKTTTKSTQPPQEQTEPQSYSQTQQPQENTQVNTTQKPAVTTQQKQTTAKKTTTAPSKPATTTQKPQTTTQKPSTTKPQNTVQWSDTMKAWRKLCEGKSLSGKEQDLIRSEILEYAQSFNGKTDIHVSFGIDEYDISYEKPLNLIIRNDMTDLSYAHMDAYADADSRWLIDYAGSEEEIYSIVSETRTNCLHVIDYGLFNRWEIYSANNALKYAGNIKFNVGFDGTAIWFLTEN